MQCLEGWRVWWVGELVGWLGGKLASWWLVVSRVSWVSWVSWVLFSMPCVAQRTKVLSVDQALLKGHILERDPADGDATATPRFR